MSFDFIVGMLILLPLLGALMAWVYRPVAELLALPFEVIAAPLVRVALAARRVVHALGSAIGSVLDALVFSDRGERSASRLWAVVIPLVFFSFFVVTLLSDIWLMALTFGGFFGIPGASTVAHLDLLLGVLWGATAAALVALAADAWFLGPTRQPWGNLSERGLKVVRVGLLAMFGLLLFGGMLFGLWRQIALRGESSRVLEYTFAMLLMLIVTFTVGLTGSYLPSAVAALKVVLLGVLRLLAQGLFVALHAAVWTLDRLAKLVVAIWRVPAALGRRLINWLASFQAIGGKLHIAPIDEFPPLPEIGGELDREDAPASIPARATPPGEPTAREAATPDAAANADAEGAREAALVGPNGAAHDRSRLPWE